ncbi:MAG: flagellar motor switch protein FliN [Thiohalomonadaceae bacterium]
MNDETKQDTGDAVQENDEAVTDDWAAAFAEQAQAEDAATPAPMEELLDEGRPLSADEVNMDVILDIPVTIAMEIGRTRINIRNLLQLNQGSVVELDRLAGEPLDVLVNGTLIAHGEVVVVNEKYGIRLTDVISPAERVKKLK